MPIKQQAFIERQFPSRSRNNFYSHNNGWWSKNCCMVASVLQNRGWKVTGFHKSELNRLPLTKKTLVKGSIRTTRLALDLIKVPQPANVDIPPSLMRFAHREIWETTLGAVRKAGKRVFIKPLHYQKAFCGHVADFHMEWRPALNGYVKEKFDLETIEFPDDFPILASTETEMFGEWRAYILNGKVREVCPRNYGWDGGGRYLILKPTIKDVQKIVSACKEKRAAWSIDVTYILDKKTDKPVLSIVETNEAFSCGYFGNNYDLYTDMTIARWNELTGAKL